GFGDGVLSSAELYNPGSEAWVTVTNMSATRFSHTASLLPDGNVLVVGGVWSPGDPASAEIFDPVSRSWSLVGSMHAARDLHTATLLPNGNVLVAGGTFNGGLSSVEVYDRLARNWA